VWEVPGGHREYDETFEKAAARETLEEIGISVEVHDHMATSVHEGQERRQRRVIMFSRAAPVHVAQPSPGDSGIVRAEWVDLRRMRPETTSAFLHPLLAWAAAGVGVAKGPILFRAEHRRDAAGNWRPHILSSVTPPAD
jgi:ADP-ribose pyrophosphatase YjhB (NUDIX family)